jgi:predicted 3-demethylubiquinone-9 3-methyltransferase (glyoxalase superfamily)
MQKIITHLWFDNQAEEAVQYYTSIFKNSSIGTISHYLEGAPGPAKPGDVLSIDFVLDGVQFIALNGGPVFTFNEAISLVVNCDGQEELDDMWNKLKEGGPVESQQCGWLKDKYGVSWQVVPANLGELMTDPDPVKAQAKFSALMQMKKIVIADLEAAGK